MIAGRNHRGKLEKMRRSTGVAVMAVVALSVWSTPSSALPRPEDTAFVVTPSTTAPAATSPASPTPSLATTTTLTDAASPSEMQKSPPPPQVRSLHVNSLVQYRYAHTVVSSRVANPANQSQEVTFSVVLPETAFISSFAMEVDGKVYKAYVKEKKEAKQTYDAAVASGQTAAHVAVSARDSNSFTVSLNVEQQNKVSFNLTYEELLTRKLGLYNHVITLNPGQVVRDLQVRVHIKENRNITKLRVPEFTSGNKIDADIQDCDDIATATTAKPAKCSSGNSLATIKWNTPTDVEVLFKPSEDEQREIVDKLEALKKKEKEDASQLLGNRHTFHRWADAFQISDDDIASGDKNKDSGLNGQFSVEYDVDRQTDGGEVVVNDGYFVHFFSPSELKPLKKHAIFVLDVSGSMDGRKIEQLREAMIAILDDLKDGDFFNLIQFSSDIKVWNLDRPESSALFRPKEGGLYYPSDVTTSETPQEVPPAYRATKENIEKAKSIVRKMSAYGGTNIFDALKTALDCARDGAHSTAMSDSDQALEPIILFLTDGDPTVGLTVPTKITAGISELNLKPRSAIFSLAFGEGADIKFLRKISLANAGFARTIYEAADASLQLKNFYRQISSPLLANVSFEYIPDKVERDSMTQVHFRTFFDGTELVVAGRTADKGVLEIGGDVKAVADGGKHASYTPRRVPVDEPLIAIWPFDPEHPGQNRTQVPRQVSVLERLWAYLTIKQLLDKQDALDASTVKEDIITPTYVGTPPPPPPPPMALPALSVAAPTPASEVSTTTTAAATSDVNSTDLDLSVLEPEPKQKALQLALKYSFVTPLTSLVVVKPNETRATDAQTVNPAAAGSDASFHGAGSGPQVQPLIMDTPARTLSYSILRRPVISSKTASVAHMFTLPTGWAQQSFQTAALSIRDPTMDLACSNCYQSPDLDPSSGPRFAAVPLSLGNKIAAPAAFDLQEESYEAFVDIRQEVDRVDSASVPEPLPVIVNITEVKWLPKDALSKGSVVLPINGTDKTYKISSNETDPTPPQSCEIQGDVPTQGTCRHFSHCVLGKIVERIEDFVRYQCTIGDYLAVCCPPDSDPVGQSATQSTPTV